MPLEPYQQDGIVFAASTGYRCLIADEPGVGKTAQALGCIKRDPHLLLPAIVVCPASLVQNWGKEAKRWLPGVPSAYIADRRDSMPRRGWKGILVMSYDQFTPREPEIVWWKPKTIIADEAHYAKNDDARRTVVLNSVVTKVPHAILLTGTPLINDPEELYNLIYMLNPEKAGDKVEFMRMAEEDPDKLRDMLKKVMIRRLFKNVLGHKVPPKRRYVIHVDMPDNVRQEYKQAEDAWHHWIEIHLPKIVSDQFKKRGIDPRTCPQAVWKVINEKARRMAEFEALSKMGRLRQIVGEAKIIPALEFAKSLIRKGESLVLFAEHKLVVDGIKAGLDRMNIPYESITGTTGTGEARERAVVNFRNSRVPMVFLASRAAYAGITLTTARYLAFVERWWTSIEEEQAEGRIYRWGQQYETSMIYFHVRKSIDDRLGDIVSEKHDMIHNLIGGTDPG
jgi:SNF2 family DNA or RNA helicase